MGSDSWLHSFLRGDEKILELDSLWCSTTFFFFFFYFWLHWVFVAVRGLSLVAASKGYSSLWCAGFLLRRLLLLRSMGSGTQASVVVAHGL